MSSKYYYLFISHAWSYSDAYTRLCNLLKADPHFKFLDFSVPRDDPIHTRGTDKELYQAIKKKMAPTQVVVILAGKYATYSKWIQKEIKIAKEEFSQPKPILAIREYGSQQVSTVVANNADLLVNWNTKSIVAAIRELAR